MPPKPVPNQYRRVAIVGVGLIGGSIGLSLRQSSLAGEVIGIGRREASLQIALDCGVVDRVTTDLTAGVAEADLVVVTTPVDLIVDQVKQVAGACHQDALLTDAGSVKESICMELASVDQFVGSHPLAGDHRSGPANARADLFVNRKVVITPTEATSPDVLEQATQFWESLGAGTMRLSPAEHDRALAATSHLPHLIASALAGGTPEGWLELAASGWEDTTRIAAADPKLWQQIFTENKEPLLESLDRFLQQLSQMRTALEADKHETLISLLNGAKRIRDDLGD